MQGVVNGVFFCNNKRTTQLSERMYNRNVPVKRLIIMKNILSFNTKCKKKSCSRF